MKYILSNNFMAHILNEAFSPKSELVLMIKSYLDKSFARVQVDDIDENGYPKLDNMVIMLSERGQQLKTMTMSELLMLLEDKYQNKIKDKEDRKKFLKQVISDWYYKKITRNGILSVNTIK